MFTSPTPSDYAKALCESVARQFQIEAGALWDMYCDIMRRNLEQDLWDIANENLTELKGE